MNIPETQRFIRLRASIENDLKNLEKLKEEKDTLRIEKAHPRILGSILHDFYTGMERIFSRIAEEMEGGLPKGKNWHRELLNDMSIELNNIRPNVITSDLKNSLEEYLEFRHLFRNVYGFELKKERLKVLIDNFDNVFLSFKDSIKGFMKFLERLSSSFEKR
jgi:hypothetical protein